MNNKKINFVYGGGGMLLCRGFIKNSHDVTLLTRGVHYEKNKSIGLKMDNKLG